MYVPIYTKIKQQKRQHLKMLHWQCERGAIRNQGYANMLRYVTTAVSSLLASGAEGLSLGNSCSSALRAQSDY